MFSIGFADEPLEFPLDDSSISAAPARLCLENAIEDFLANLAVWSKSDYESHWRRELRALLDGTPKVSLIVSYNDPKNPPTWRFGTFIATVLGLASKTSFVGATTYPVILM